MPSVCTKKKVKKAKQRKANHGKPKLSNSITKFNKMSSSTKKTVVFKKPGN